MMGIRAFALWSIAFGASFVAMGATAEAGQVTFTGNYAYLKGTGNGPILGVLSLQDASDDHEWGYSGWASPSGVGKALYGTGGQPPAETWSNSGTQVHKDTVSSGYFAQSVGALAAAGVNASNLALAFQVNVAGSNDTMTIRAFNVVFIHADGSLVGKLCYTPDGHSLAGTTIAGLGAPTAQTTDNGVLAGVGQGTSGWLYTLDLSSILAADSNFFNVSGNRIGMEVVEKVGGVNNFSPVNDGSDNFFFTTADTVAPVPLPSAAWMGMGVLAALGIVQARRRRRSSF